MQKIVNYSISISICCRFIPYFGYWNLAFPHSWRGSVRFYATYRGLSPLCRCRKRARLERPKELSAVNVALDSHRSVTEGPDARDPKDVTESAGSGTVAIHRWSAETRSVRGPVHFVTRRCRRRRVSHRGRKSELFNGVFRVSSRRRRLVRRFFVDRRGLARLFAAGHRVDRHYFR